MILVLSGFDKSFLFDILLFNISGFDKLFLLFDISFDSLISFGY